MKLKTIPISELKISRLNMRHGGKAPDVSDILPSIREKGVRQSLLVRKEGKSYGVVAGRRRLFALRKVAKETGKDIKAPCGILEEGDDATAIEASIIENIARLPATEMEQYDAFGRLAKAGRSVADIAEYFGVTALKVKRILALSDLNDEIRQLYADDKIKVPTIRALTLATSEQQTTWLALYHNEDEYEPHGDQLKSWLTGGDNISTRVALFDLETFEGILVTDLFDDVSYFKDPDQFWEHQNAAIAEAVKEYREQGWKDVVVMERGDQFRNWSYSKRPLDAGGKVYMEVRHSGEVTAHSGYLTNEDAKKIDAILSGEAEDSKTAPKSTKPEMSGPLSDYVRLHRHAMTRASLLDHPNIALRLSVAHMIMGSGLWQVRAHQTGAVKDATCDSVENSDSHTKFVGERESVRELLGILWEGADLVGTNAYDSECAGLFVKLLDLSDEDVMRVLTLAMAESLSSQSLCVDAIGHVTDIDMQAQWQPDEAFFDILRDKRVINAMVNEIAGEATANSVLTDTGKKQKTIITNRIAGHGVNEPDLDWRPRWMSFPASSYLDGDDASSAISSRAVAALLGEHQSAQEKPKLKDAA